MLFNKKNCDHCGETIDEMLDYCPFCHERNIQDGEEKKKFKILFIPWPKQLMLFGIGVIGFIVFNVLFSIIFANIYKEDSIRGNMFINLGSYLLFFAFVILLMYPYWRSLLDAAKDKNSYIYGVIGAIFVIGGSILINLLMKTISGIESEGGNQSAIAVISKLYPAFSIIIFGLIGPICEEAAYRVGLFSFLRRIHPAVAYIGSALIFGLIHFDFTGNLIVELVALPSYLWAGISFAIIYEFGGILASSTSHILNNLFAIILLLI